MAGLYGWLIQYENDEYPTIAVSGSREKAEAMAAKRNKYNESYTITEAPKPDRTIEKEQAMQNAIKYGCSIPGL